MPTYSPKASEITRAWYVVDAEGLVLGRLATEVASVLRGKHKPTYAPHIDTGDHVIIVNADKVVLTADKARPQAASTATRGYPGGIKLRDLRRPAGPQARRRRAPHHPGHAAPRTASAAHSSPSSRSTPARPTPTPPSSPSRSSSTPGPPPGAPPP